jgi:hypothetical protein
MVQPSITPLFIKEKNIELQESSILSVIFPSGKINMGQALFGRTYKLAKSSQNKLGSPISSLSSPGNVLKFIFYN